MQQNISFTPQQQYDCMTATDRCYITLSSVKNKRPAMRPYVKFTNLTDAV